MDNPNRTLVTIDPSTGAVANLSASAFDYDVVGGMTAVGDTGYFVNSDGFLVNGLYSFDMTSGTYARIGTLSDPNLNDNFVGLAAAVPEPGVISILALALLLSFRASGSRCDAAKYTHVILGLLDMK